MAALFFDHSLSLLSSGKRKNYDLKKEDFFSPAVGGKLVYFDALIKNRIFPLDFTLKGSVRERRMLLRHFCWRLQPFFSRVTMGDKKSWLVCVSPFPLLLFPHLAICTYVQQLEGSRESFLWRSRTHWTGLCLDNIRFFFFNQRKWLEQGRLPNSPVIVTALCHGPLTRETEIIHEASR